MKKILLMLLFALPAGIAAAAPCDSLQQYLDEANYFKLRNALNNADCHATALFKSYCEVFMYNAFNQNPRSIELADSLLNIHDIKLDDKQKASLLELLIDNYSKTYQYKKAAESGDLIVQKYAKAVENLDDVKNTNKIWHALADIAPQAVEQTTDVIVPIHKDVAALWNISVAAGDVTDDFIFDTGANISTVTESTAKHLGIKKLNVSFSVSGMQGKDVESDLGVADSLKIGDITLRNVVFLIMPDESFNFPQINYTINGILGFPVINALKEVRISKKGTLEVPMAPSHSDLNNLALDGLFPMISMVADNDTLVFHFDTGAKNSDLYSPYYKLHQKQIIKNGAHKDVTVGGAGGFVKIPSYELRNFKVHIGGQLAVIRYITVFTEPIKDSKELVYG
ncbi:MAG: retropepsin-like aspartic protease family protein, partial [Flavipsychrobacter sp.]